MRYTASGKPVTQFSLAVNRPRRSGGNQQEETDWFRVVCWDRLAETADQYLTKGTKVYVEGRLQVRPYTSGDGQERTSIEVVARDLIILTPRGATAAPEHETAPSGTSTGGDEFDIGDDFDDVPF